MNKHILYSALQATATPCTASLAGVAPQITLPQWQVSPQIGAQQINPAIIAQLNPSPQGWKLAWRNNASGAFMSESKPVRRLDCPPDTTFTTQGVF